MLLSRSLLLAVAAITGTAFVSASFVSSSLPGKDATAPLLTVTDRLTSEGIPAHEPFTAAMGNCVESKIFSTHIQKSVFNTLDTFLVEAEEAREIGVQSDSDVEVLTEIGTAFKGMMTEARQELENHMKAAIVSKINGYAWTGLALGVCGSVAYGGLAVDSYDKLNSFLFKSDNGLYILAGLFSIAGKSLHTVVKKFAPFQVMRNNPGATRWALSGLLNLFAPTMLHAKEESEDVSGVLAGILAVTTFLHVQDLMHSPVVAANGVSRYEEKMDEGMDELIDKLDPEMRELIKNVAAAKADQEAEQEEPRALLRSFSSTLTVSGGEGGADVPHVEKSTQTKDMSNDAKARKLLEIMVKAAKAKRTQDTAEPTEAPTDQELLVFSELAMEFKKPPMDQGVADMVDEAITPPVLYVASFLPVAIGLCFGYDVAWTALFGIGAHQLYFALTMARDPKKDVFDVHARVMSHGSTKGLTPSHVHPLAKALILGQVAFMGVAVARLSKAVIIQNALSGASPSEVMSTIKATDLLVLVAIPFISKALEVVKNRIARPFLAKVVGVSRTKIPLEHISVRLLALNLSAFLAFGLSMGVHYLEYVRVEGMMLEEDQHSSVYPVLMAALGHGRVPRPLELLVNTTNTTGAAPMVYDDSFITDAWLLSTETVQQAGFIGMLGDYISIVYNVFDGWAGGVTITQLLQIAVSILALSVVALPDNASADTVIHWEEFYAKCFGLAAAQGLGGQLGYLAATVTQYKGRVQDDEPEGTPFVQLVDEDEDGEPEAAVVVGRDGSRSTVGGIVTRDGARNAVGAALQPGGGLDQATMDWMK